MKKPSLEDAAKMLLAYNLTGSVTAIVMGHINATFRVKSGETTFILQRLSSIFSPHVNEDIDVITRHLEAVGVQTPRPVRTAKNELWAVDDDQAPWRLLSFVEGHSYQVMPSPDAARSAALMLARFHRALTGFTYTFKAKRLGVHDTKMHLDNLRETLRRQVGHPAIKVVQPLAADILALSATLPELQTGKTRIVHGDPKISNFIFSGDNEAIAMVDLDTLGHMPVALELGDALRSWCSPAGEGTGDTFFSLAYFEAAVSGYADGARDLLSPEEVATLADALAVVAVELAARFAKDALDECYFGWDSQVYPTASAHNVVRAHSQLRLARAYLAERGRAEAIIRRAFAVV